MGPNADRQPADHAAAPTPPAPTVAPVVRVRALRRTYAPADGPVLDGIDLEVAPGEWVAIMGPSGCGKSTLLHLFGGLDLPDAGEVEVAGQVMSRGSEAARARLRQQHVGIVFQAYNLLPQLDVAANVELPLRLAGARRSQARARRRELLDLVGLADVATRAAATLSGGQQQRVALARALASRPALVLADEPTGALDTAAADSVLELLRACHRDGQAIVMVTHDHRVAAAADRVVVMQDGRIVDQRWLAGTNPVAFSSLVTLEGW